MFNVNRVTLLGNATRDAETKATKAGKMLAVLGLATNRRWKDQQGELKSEPEFHRLICFGPLADFSTQRVKKGAPLYVEGRLHTGKWKTDDGKEASHTDIVVDRLVLLSARKTGEAEAVEGDAEQEEVESAA